MSKKKKYLAMALTNPPLGMTMGIDFGLFVEMMKEKKDELEDYRLVGARMIDRKEHITPLLEMELMRKYE